MEKKHLKNCTAEDFASLWRRYDADGNGYIEEGELKNFLADLAKIEDVTDIADFMKKHDKNKDGKIDMKELADILKPEENFLFLIRTEGGPDSKEFKKIWTKYDADKSGFIEASELKSFLRDAYASCGKALSEAKLEEYTKAALSLYDRDDNHKLDFNEMIKLLPIATNYLKDLQFDKLTEADFKEIFKHYDTNKDDSIEDRELDKLISDLLRRDGKATTPQSIASLKTAVMSHCDKNKDGKIQLNELKLLLSFKQ